MSLDIENAMLFESPGIAESVAAHLRFIGVTNGIKTKLAEWKAQTRAKFPPIVGTAPMTPGEKVWASRRANQAALAKKREKMPDSVPGSHLGPCPEMESF